MNTTTRSKSFDFSMASKNLDALALHSQSMCLFISEYHNKRQNTKVEESVRDSILAFVFALGLFIPKSHFFFTVQRGPYFILYLHGDEAPPITIYIDKHGSASVKSRRFKSPESKKFTLKELAVFVVTKFPKLKSKKISKPILKWFSETYETVLTTPHFKKFHAIATTPAREEPNGEPGDRGETGGLGDFSNFGNEGLI